MFHIDKRMTRALRDRVREEAIETQIQERTKLSTRRSGCKGLGAEGTHRFA